MSFLRMRFDSLWVLAAPPCIWLLHFLLSYLTASLWCAKLSGLDGSLRPARLAIAAYSVVAISALVWLSRRLYVRWHEGRPADGSDSAEDRRVFMAFVALLLALLSLVSIVYATMTILFIGSCR